MNRIGPDTTADLFFQITWSSNDARHGESYAGYGVNFWRDVLPEALYHDLMGKQPGDTSRIDLSIDELSDNTGPTGILSIGRRQFDGERIHRKSLQPRVGRFYPRGILKDMAGIFKANMVPFRCVGKNNGRLGISLDHPMAGKDIGLKVTVGSIQSKLEERGGTVRNWGEIITQGIGMQARWREQPTDFFADYPFRRKDKSPDTDFYAAPRLVNHIDSMAMDMVRQIYARFLRDDMHVLDLMSSWQSHLPQNLRLKHVAGLGLNSTELEHNDRLHVRVVQDLNGQADLPFENGAFDAVLCSLSVEYLTAPFQIFNEVARVLKKGGPFVVSFSNRWFEPKAIRIWSELHEFERMGLVMEYFRRSRQFDALETCSLRGLPRPADDKYYGKVTCADPVYVVWGRKK